MNREHTSTDKGQPIVVVSGLPRSGTSMTMQMLAAAGIAAVTDGIRAPSEDNPRGYFEDERVKRLYQKGGDRSWLSEARGKAIKIISFLLKHLPESNDYRIIFMDRDMEEMLMSQRTMLQAMGELPDGASDARMASAYTAHLNAVHELLSSRRCFEAITLNYGEVIASASEHASRIDQFLGGRLDVSKMAAAVDATLYRSRR